MREDRVLLRKMEHVLVVGKSEGVVLDDAVLQLLALYCGDDVEGREIHTRAAIAVCRMMGVRINFSTVKAYLDG